MLTGQTPTNPEYKVSGMEAELITDSLFVVSDLDTIYYAEMVCEKGEVIDESEVLNKGNTRLCEDYQWQYMVDKNGNRVTQYSHDWVYKSKPSWLGSQNEVVLLDFYSNTPSDACPSETLIDYERVCRKCLRHEKRLKVQEFNYVDLRETEFYRVLNKIK